MPRGDQQNWNERYLAGEFSSREPDEFVMEAHKNYLTPLLPSDSAGLDLAGGAGHHAIWLARQGWRMTLADWSAVALDIARKKAQKKARKKLSELPDLPLELAHGSAMDLLARFQAEEKRFGFILVSFFLDRSVLPLLSEALLPGGLLLYRTYTEDNERLGNPRGPRDPAHLLRSQELLDVYRGMTILHYNETVAAKGVAEMIARRNVD